MRKRSMWLVGGALAIVASLVIGPSATAKTEGASAGTVVIVHDQEPGILNGYLASGNGYTVSLVMNPVLAGGLIYNDKVELVPYLFEALPKLLVKEPLKVSFKYKANANWSDGKPVTGADFLATYKTIMNPNWDIVSRDGWVDIAKVQVKGKAVTVTFKKGRAYAAWDNLLGVTSPVPAHKVAGQDFNKMWSDSIDISSGPFKFSSWQRGTQLTIVKNPAFKAGASAKVDRIVVKYIAGASQFQALKSGEGDVVEPQPQIQIVDFQSDPKFKVQSGPGYQWEHIDFQQGEKAAPALKLKYVRQAIMQGINRAQIREVLYIKPGLVKKQDMPVLQSNIFKPFEPGYEKPYARWGFSQRNVIALLKKNGCTGGPDKPSAGNSNIFSCPNVGKLSFAFTTTSGNPTRALTFEIIQKQLKSVGIEITPRFISPAVLFGGGMLSSGDWQMVLFTFLSDPTGPATYFGIDGCGGDQNYDNSCNPKSSALLKKAQFTADPTDRNKLLHAAEVIMAEDVYNIPVFSRPTFLLNNVRVKGPVKNPTQQGSTWNAEAWRVTS